MNYHGFAAQLLERYGMLAGIEPDQRVLSPAQRTELCARVMDLMTFEHVKTENQGGVIDNILLLDDQAANHRARRRRSSRSTRSGWSSCRSTVPTARIARRWSASSSREAPRSSGS